MNRIEAAPAPAARELSEAFVVAAGEELQRSRQELVASIDQLDPAEPVRADIERSLAEVDRALGRIEAGTYGRCSVCDGSIPPERLEVVPAADLCVRCRHEHETRAY